MRWISAEESSERRWDVIVVGSGIGGATVARALASGGKKVLVVTKRASLLWQDLVHDRSKNKKMKPFLGDGFGGSSVLYGMVMERLEATDFESASGRWPDSLGGWTPAYERAEKMFHVRPATKQPEFEPLYARLRSQGFETSPLNLASLQIPGCRYCQSRTCETGCKISAVTGPLAESDRDENLFFVAARVVRIAKLKSSGVEIEVHGEIGSESKASRLTADQLVLAAGALRTPGLLRQISDLPAIGHYFMRHLIDCYVLNWSELKRHDLTTRGKLAEAKAWGSHSVYQKDGLNLGTVQSFGRPPDFEIIWEELESLNSILRWTPFAKRITEFAVEKIFSHPVAASIVEDEPEFENRIESRADGAIDLHYRLSPRDLKKIAVMRKTMKTAFGPYLLRMLPESENNFRLAHACGTCRIGTDHNLSVVDKFGRVHNGENIWVADASVFPSSSGKNPALTIAAHALRVADRILERQT